MYAIGARSSDLFSPAECDIRGSIQGIINHATENLEVDLTGWTQDINPQSPPCISVYLDNPAPITLQPIFIISNHKMSFQGQPQFQPMTYIITGAARGIGRHLSLSLVSRGARVVLLDNNMDELSHTLTLLSKRQQYREQYIACECNLASRLQIRNAVESARRFLGGRLECLINNAMAMPHTWPHGGGMDEGDENEVMRHWDAQIAVGLSAPMYLARLCVPMLKREGWRAGVSDKTAERPGCIINVASTRASQAEMDHEGYSAAKAGLIGLTQSLSVSLGTRYGIRVNAVLPGWIDVQAECKAADEKGTKWADGISKEEHAWQLNGRVGKPEDVMEAVDYLVGATFMTGQELTVSGGVERRMVYPED